MKMSSAAVAVLAIALGRPAHAQGPADRVAVERAALDYLEAFYEGDSTKLLRSIRPEVQKYGYFIPRGKEAYQGEPMSFQEMLDYARRVKATGRGAPEGAPKKVEILDILDQTAAAKVTAWWGTDYLQLARHDGRWMILHVMWQSPAKK